MSCAGLARDCRAVPAGWAAARLLVERNAVAYRHRWTAIVSGFFEPVFYLFSLGVGIGALVGAVEVGGERVDYAAFVAPRNNNASRPA